MSRLQQEPRTSWTYINSVRVFIVDINVDETQGFVSGLNQSRPNSAHFLKCDVSSWDDLTSAFTKALDAFERIDYVFPVAGITERQVIPKPSEQKDVRKSGFVKPDLAVIDINLNAMLNLILIAAQAFRGQQPTQKLGGMRGKSTNRGCYLSNIVADRSSCLRGKHLRTVRNDGRTYLYRIEAVRDPLSYG